MGESPGKAMESGGWTFNLIASPLLSLLLFLSVFFIPVFGWAMNIFAPLPLIHYFYTHGRQPAQIAVVGAAIAVAVFFGMRMGFFYLMSYGLLALVMAEMINRISSMERAIVSSGVAAMASTAIVTWLSLQVPLGELASEFTSLAEEMITGAVDTYRQSGVSEMELDAIRKSAPGIARWSVLLMPGIAAVFYLFLASMNYLGYKLLQKRWSFMPPPDPAPIVMWSPPERTVFVLTAAGALSLIPGDVLRPVGFNLLIVVGSVYGVAGFCIILFFFNKFRLPFFMRWIGYILILLQPFILTGVAMLGLLDLWFDFRKIRKPEAGDMEE